MSRAIFEKLECEELAVAEICRPRQHKTISATDFTDTGYPVFGANGFVGFYSEYTHQNESVAVTCRGSTCGTVNFIPPKTYITGNSMAMDDLDTSRVDLRYLYHALIARGLTDIISGSAQPQIVKSAFEVVHIKIPSLEEQMKIAKFLSKLEEIANLAHKLGLKIKKQKQGLMQKLLTGKVRVKV
jgi:type I restriction enzyme, S subunit